MTGLRLNVARVDSADRPRPPRFAMGRGAVNALAAEPPFDLSRTILENSRAIVYVKDLEGRYLFVNRRFEEVLGIHAVGLIGRTDFHVHDPETARRLRENDARVLRAGKPEEIEEIVRPPGADEPHAYISVKEPLFDAEGRAFALCGISTDITELKRARESLALEKQRYRSLIEATAAIVWGRSANGGFETEQPGWSEFTGQTFDELKGWGWLDAVHPDDREEASATWTRAVATRTTYVVEHRLRRRDGDYRDMSVQGVPILGSDGTLSEWMGVHIDVTERKTARVALRYSHERLATVLEASGTGTYLWDLKTDAMEWDERLRELVGAAPDYKPEGRDVLGWIHPDDRPAMARALGSARTGSTQPPAEYRVLRPDGEVRWIRLQGRVFQDADGTPSHSIGGCVDVTNLKLAERELSHRATHDMLTGMANRSFLHAAMEARIAAGPEGSRFAFLLLDLDRFKEINDGFGHDHGDAVLKEMRPRLEATVVRPHLLARLGGDEFGILLYGAGREEAAETARAIVAMLQRPIFVNGQALEVGASVGIAVHPDQGRDVASLTRVADVAMYSAKRACSGWAIYQADQEHASPRCLTMVGELRRAVEEDQLRLRYQPKMDLRSMREVGVEALVRWEHPRDGLMQPGGFIPIAEKTGLIHPLCRWVIDRAMRDCRRWIEAGVAMDVAVNLAPDRIQDPGLVDYIVEALARHEVPAPRVTFEITETAMMRNPAQARDVLLKLHEMGIQISIDDFGTGYSSLAYLKELPVDEVKVDQSFVKDAAANQRDACIVRSVIDLGHNLGLRVVAEGVEDAATLELLKTWGCDLAQGFFVGRPAPAEAFLQRRPSV